MAQRRLDVLSLASFVALGLPDGMLGTAWPAMRARSGDRGRHRHRGPVRTVGWHPGRRSEYRHRGSPAGGRLLNLLHGFYGIGTAIRPLVVTIAIVAGSWQPAYFFLLAVDAALAVLWAMHGRAAAGQGPKAGDPARPDSDSSPEVPWPPAVRAAVVTGIAVFFVHTGLEVAAGQWETTYGRGYLHLSASQAGLATFAGSGDGSPLLPISGNAYTISAGSLSDANGDNPLQVVNAYGSIYGTGLPDLVATGGDPVNGYYLDYYAAGAPGAYINTFAIHAPTPDGTADWNDWTLATLSYSGGTGMFMWNEQTGALYLWTGVNFTDNGDGTGTSAYRQYKISAAWNKGRALSTLEAADFDADGVPDLWAVTPAGVATAYVISHLSLTAAARITAGMPQKLS